MPIAVPNGFLKPGLLSLLLLASTVSADATSRAADDEKMATAQPVASTPAAFTPARLTAREAAALYGGDLEFDVFRKGKKIGRHETRFIETDEGLKVINDMQLKVKVLFIVAYKLRYQSEVLWRDGQPVSIKARVNDNGDKHEIIGRVEGDQFVWNTFEGEQQSGPAIGDYFPTDHWHPAVIDKSRIFNTLTGEQIGVSIKPITTETIESASGPIEAQRFKYSGDLTNRSWYTDDGRWVGMAFEGNDGSTIRYVCRKCGQNKESALDQAR